MREIYGLNFGYDDIPAHLVRGTIRLRKRMPNGTIGLLVGATSNPRYLPRMLAQADNGRRHIHTITVKGWNFLYAYWD